MDNDFRTAGGNERSCQIFKVDLMAQVVIFFVVTALPFHRSFMGEQRDAGQGARRDELVKSFFSELVHRIRLNQRVLGRLGVRAVPGGGTRLQRSSSTRPGQGLARDKPTWSWGSGGGH